jgi:hypothetical protein
MAKKGVGIGLLFAPKSKCFSQANPGLAAGESVSLRDKICASFHGLLR